VPDRGDRIDPGSSLGRDQAGENRDQT